MGYRSPEDPTRQPPVRSLGELARRIVHVATTPDAELAQRIGNIVTDRRAILGAGLAAGATISGLEILAHPEWIDGLKLLFNPPPPEVVSGAKELLDIINNQPSEEQLRGRIVNRGKKINLEEARQQVIANTNGRQTSLRVRVLGLGDSNFYTFGLKNDGKGGHPDPQDQPHSFIESGRDSINQHLGDIGIDSWETYTFAVPGAPSGDGYPTESRKYGLLGPEQFFNPDFQNMLRGKAGEEDVLNVVTISATGDDWRLLMENALKLANFFSKVENIQHATKADVDEFKALLAESNKIGQDYGDHIQQCLTQIALVNEDRRKRGLLDVKVAIAHPFSMLETQHIPFRTLAGDDDKVKDLQGVLKKVNPDNPKDDRHYLDITKIPYGQKIAYLITVAMYTQLAQRMAAVSTTNSDFVMPLEWMGLEQAQDFFYIDGHPGEDGTPMQSALFLNMFEGVSQRLGDATTLDKVVQLPSQIAQVVEAVTHAKAA